MFGGGPFGGVPFAGVLGQQEAGIPGFSSGYAALAGAAEGHSSATVESEGVAVSPFAAAGYAERSGV